MADERTYGFNRDDAQSLIQSISSGESIFPEIRPRGRGRSEGGEFIEWDSMLIDCPSESNPYGTGNWYVTPTAYSGGCKTIPGIIDDPYSDYDGMVEVLPPKCGSVNLPSNITSAGGGSARRLFPVNDCTQGFWRADDYCVANDCG